MHRYLMLSHLWCINLGSCGRSRSGFIQWTQTNKYKIYCILFILSPNSTSGSLCPLCFTHILKPHVQIQDFFPLSDRDRVFLSRRSLVHLIIQPITYVCVEVFPGQGLKRTFFLGHTRRRAWRVCVADVSSCEQCVGQYKREDFLLLQCNKGDDQQVEIMELSLVEPR